MNDNNTRLVEAYRAADVAEAHLIRLALEDAGIHSQIDGEALQGSEYPLGWSTAPRILVAESLVAPAREIIGRAHAHRGTDGDVDPDFELLSCLAGRPWKERKLVRPVDGRTRLKMMSAWAGQFQTTRKWLLQMIRLAQQAPINANQPSADGPSAN